MAITLSQALLAIALLIAAYIYRRSKNPYGSTVANTPYLPPSVPVLGALGYALDPSGWMEKMHTRMGDVFTTSLFGYNVTFVRGQKNVHRWATATNAELDVNSAYKTIAGRIVGNEVFESGNVSRWVNEAMSTKRLDSIQPQLHAFSQSFLKTQLPSSSKDWSVPFDLTPLLVEATLQLGAWVLCGAHLAETHGTELARVFHVLETDLSIIGIVMPLPTPAVRRRNRAKDRSFEIIEGEIRQRVEEMQRGHQGEDDFLRVVLGEHIEDEVLAHGDEKEIVKRVHAAAVTVYGLIWGAHTNTAASSIAAFTDLLTHPQYLSEALSQPPDAPFSTHTFLLRCLTETFRRRSRGTLVRMAKQPFTISDPQSGVPALTAPPGFVLVSPTPLSLSPTTYPDPVSFNPERYEAGKFPYSLDTLQSPSVASSVGLFSGWGLGKHACPGRFLAYRIVGTIVLTMLGHGGWEMEMVGTPPGWEPLGTGGIDRPRGPLTVRVRRR